MDDSRKNQKQLIAELNELRQSNAILKRLEEEIKSEKAEQEKFTKAFLQGSIPSSITTLKEGRFIEANNAFLKFVGLNRDEVIGHTSTEMQFITNEQRSSFLSELNKSGRVENLEMSVMTKYGELRYGLFNAVMMTLGNEKYLLTVMADITNRKLAEETLRESERKFRTIFESLEDIYCEADLNGNIKLISPSIYRKWGLKPEELIGKPATLFYAAPDGRSALLTALSKYGYVRDYNINLTMPDGSKVAASLAARLVYDSNGYMIGTAGFFRDITSRKRMEKELSESETRFRMFAEHAQDMIYRMSWPDGKYEYVSSASLDLTGFTPEEYYKFPVHIKNIIHPDFSSYLKQQWKLLLQGKMSPFYEYKIIHKDGSERWLQQRNFLVCDERGSAIAIEGIVRNVTASKIDKETIKQKEEKYRLITEGITDCITLVGENGTIQYVTNSLEILGYNSEELIGINGLNITHPDDLEMIMSLNRGAFEQVFHEITSDLSASHKDGHYAPMEISVRKLIDPQGKVIGCVFVASNIPKRKEEVALNSSPVIKLCPTDRRLSVREREIMNWIMQGKSTWDISAIINISESTVNFHINNLMKKLGAVNRSHAVAIVLQDANNE